VQFLNFDNAHPHTERVNRWIDLNAPNCPIYYKKGKYRVKKGYDDKPVTLISHLGARAYAMWRGGRLPTEAELALAKKQGKLKNMQVDLWCQDNYSVDFFENLENNALNPFNKNKTGQHTVIDKAGQRKGYFSNNFYSNVGFRVVLPKE